MSSTKFPTWFFWFVLFSLWIFPEVQQSSTWPLTQIRNISIPNMLHIRLENFQLQSVFTPRWFDLQEQTERKEDQSRAGAGTDWRGSRSSSSAIGRHFHSQRRTKSGRGRGFLFFCGGQHVFASLSTVSDKGLIKHCAALKLAVGRWRIAVAPCTSRKPWAMAAPLKSQEQALVSVGLNVIGGGFIHSKSRIFTCI